MRGLLRKVSVPTVIASTLAFNGFLNLATGLAGIFRIAAYFSLDRVPEYLRVTPSHQVSGLLSVFLGLLLIGLGKGLYERRQRSWDIAIAVLVILTANNLYRRTTPQTAILSLLLIAGLILFRRRFNMPSEEKVGYGQVIAWASVLFALGYGVVGSYVLRAQFDGIETWTDALYFTLVTYSTLGFGDILPKSSNARIFVVSMIPIGIGSFITALTVLLGPAIEKRLKGVLRIMKGFQKTDHVVICGYSNVSESAIDELQRRGAPYVIVETRQDLALHLGSKGHDVIMGDPTRRETLERANIGSALALIAAFDSDSVNILIAVTTKEIRESTKGCRLRIVVRVEDEENVMKAKRVGADEVISPSTSAGRLMATRAIESGEAQVMGDHK